MVRQVVTGVLWVWGWGFTISVIRVTDENVANRFRAGGAARYAIAQVNLVPGMLDAASKVADSR